MSTFCLCRKCDDAEGSCTEEEKAAEGGLYSPCVMEPGAKPVQIVLKQAGLRMCILWRCSVCRIEFSTLRLPNPEEVDALKMAIEQAKACGADLVITTDPDADRMEYRDPQCRRQYADGQSNWLFAAE